MKFVVILLCILFSSFVYAYDCCCPGEKIIGLILDPWLEEQFEKKRYGCITHTDFNPHDYEPLDFGQLINVDKIMTRSNHPRAMEEDVTEFRLVERTHIIEARGDIFSDDSDYFVSSEDEESLDSNQSDEWKNQEQVEEKKQTNDSYNQTIFDVFVLTFLILPIFIIGIVIGGLLATKR